MPKQCIQFPKQEGRVVPPFKETASTVDWRNWGIVNDIQDQITCGSCFAFSTVATAETAYAIKTGKLYKVSE